MKESVKVLLVGKGKCCYSKPALALKRTKTSSQNAIYVLSEMVFSFGYDVSMRTVNHSLFRWQGFSAYLESYRIRGKLVEDSAAGPGFENLIGEPKPPSGTDAAHAEAVFECLEDWHFQ